MTRIRTILQGLLTLAMLGYGAWLAVKWGIMRVYVPPHMALMVVNKFGDPLPPHLIAVPPSGEYSNCKGVQEELRGPGRYFLNPVAYDWKLVEQVKIPAGDPHQWRFTEEGSLQDDKTRPMVGLIASKQGREPPPGAEIVDPGFKGIQRDVLTPGTYKINPHVYSVTLVPAVVVPPGFMGVVTRLFGDSGDGASATLSAIRESSPGPTTAATVPHGHVRGPSRLITASDQRGVLREVLQPGMYYFNPRLLKVDVVPVGYDAITTRHDHKQPTQDAIRFYSADGYLVEADFTVVWGIGPSDAPEIVANIGNWQRVSTNVIEPAMKAACQNVGAKYTSKELIQGQTRSKFQDELSASLEQTVASRNVHVLLALIRNIVVMDTAGNDATGGLLRTIQRANIEVENQLTNRQKTQTAMTAARLEEALKEVDVARETVASETNVKVANILAEGEKTAAEIEAQRDLDVATVELEISRLDAQRKEILGKAGADVQRLRSEAEAKGAKLLVDALGSPQNYNLYVFAKNFEPTDLRLIFAGEGTFWTDLKSFDQIDAARRMGEGAK